MKKLPRTDYDNHDWSEFYLDPLSPSGLSWNKTSYSCYGKKLEIWPGKHAGYKRGKYWRVNVNFEGGVKNVAVHRVICVLSGNKINGMVIDHIDGNGLNNKPENLRVVTTEVNTRNAKPRKDSAYGITGISSSSDSPRFIAYYQDNNKRKFKSFPIDVLGIMEAFRQAVVFRESKINELNIAGFMYSERHTKFTPVEDDFSYYENNGYKSKIASRTIPAKVNTASGIAGVSFYSDRATAFWTDEFGYRKSKSFSINKHGLLPAFSKAIAYRFKMIEELNTNGEGYSYSLDYIQYNPSLM